MTTSRKFSKLKKYLLLLLAMQMIFIVYSLWDFHFEGHLPAPFFYDQRDTFMDLFNTNYWANRAGRYEDWNSIYPIFTFMLGQWLTPDRCVVLSSPMMRTCSAGSIWFLVAFYALGAISCGALAIRHLQFTGARRFGIFLLISFMVFFAMPGLFALERGNYIVLSFLCLALSEWSGRDWKGALFLAMAINIKQYLILLWLAPFLKRRYDYLVVSILFSIGINLFAMILVQDDHYSMVLENMLGFSSGMYTGFFEKMWYTTSFLAWLKALELSPDLARFFDPALLSFGMLAASLMMGAIALLALGSILTLISRASEVSWELICLIVLVALLMVTDSLGGYSLLLLIPYLVTLLVRQQLQPVLPLLLLLFTPLDWVIGPHHLSEGKSYLSGVYMNNIAGLTVESYLRPGALVLLMIYLIYTVFESSSRKNSLQVQKNLVLE